MVRPHLSVNMAMTLDGKVMLPDGTWHGLTSSMDRKTMDEYRAAAQVLIVGRNSVEKDNPVFALKDGRDGPRPVMICRSRLPARHLRFFQHHPLLYVSTNLKKEADALQDVCETIITDELSPDHVLQDLASRGYENVLLEGGPSLNADFFALDLVDVLYLTIVPYVLGDSRLPGIVDREECLPDFKDRTWTLARCEKIDNEIFTEYHRKRE